jgi:hypothetical protein
MDMSEFLSFKRMLTPAFIQVIFWLGVAFCVIGGIVMIANPIMPGQDVMGILLLLLGPIVVRIYCEIVIVLFRINENLTDIRNNQTLSAGRGVSGRA